MRTTSAVAVCAVFALLAGGLAQSRQAPVRPPTRPIDPIAGILDAFKTHSVVFSMVQRSVASGIVSSGLRVRLSSIRMVNLNPQVPDR
jgi:hypothetical protein